MSIYNQTHYLYWIHYPHHTDPFTEGYIGISVDPAMRFKHHKNSKRNKMVLEAISHGAKMELLSEYSNNGAAKLVEKQYRPEWGIGWNKSPGGGEYPGGWNKGKSNSEKHIQNKSIAMKKYWQSPSTINGCGSLKYEITFPDGHTEIIVNMARFCRENNLQRTNMSRVSRGIRKQHKGYKCTKIAL